MTGLVDRMIPVLFAAGVAMVSIMVRATLEGPSAGRAGIGLSWGLMVALLIVATASFVVGLILANRRAGT